MQTCELVEELESVHHSIVVKVLIQWVVRTTWPLVSSCFFYELSVLSVGPFAQSDVHLSSHCFFSGDKSSDNEGVRLAKRLTETKEPVTMELVKGTMLGVADQMVTSLSDVLVEAAQFDQGMISWHVLNVKHRIFLCSQT